MSCCRKENRWPTGHHFWWSVGLKYTQLALVYNFFLFFGWTMNVSFHRKKSAENQDQVPVRLNCFCCRADWGEGCRGEGGVALLGRGGAGEEGVEEVVDEGLLLESGWYGTEM